MKKVLFCQDEPEKKVLFCQDEPVKKVPFCQDEPDKINGLSLKALQQQMVQQLAAGLTFGYGIV